MVLDVSDAEIRHVHYVHMTQPPRRLCFAFETLRELGMLRQLRNDHLKGDCSHGPQMSGLKDRAHAALAKLPFDAILVVQNGTWYGTQWHRLLLKPLSQAIFTE